MPRSRDANKGLEWMRQASQIQSLIGQLLSSEDRVAGISSGPHGLTEIGEPELQDCLAAVLGSTTNTKSINKIIRSIQKQSPDRRTYLVGIVVVIGITSPSHSHDLAYLPVFRLLTEPARKTKYVDSCARVYRDWSHFLATNKLPKATICYPKDGVYTGKDTPIEFSTTPSSKLAYKVDKWVYFGSLAASAAAGLVGFSGMLLTVASPVMVAALAVGLVAGSAVAVRSARRLWDRAQHGQHLRPNSSAARRSWLDLACFTLDAASATTLVKCAVRARQGFLVVQHGTQAVKTVKLVNFVGTSVSKCKDLHVMKSDGHGHGHRCGGWPEPLVGAIGLFAREDPATLRERDHSLLQEITTRRE